MIIYIVKPNIIESYAMPSILDGSFWVFDKNEDGKERSLFKICATNDGWRIDSNEYAKVIIDDKNYDYAIIKTGSYCKLRIGHQVYILYCLKKNDKTFKAYKLATDSITISDNENADIVYKNKLLKNYDIKINKKNNVLTYSSNCGVLYVNKINSASGVLKNGDIIFFLGLKIYFINDTIYINEFNDIKISNSFKLIAKSPKMHNIENDSEIIDYADNDYFHRSPRFITKIEEETVTIDPPPKKMELPEQSLLLRVGPSLTMAMVSALSAFVTVQNMRNSSDVSSLIVPIGMAVSMLFAALLWPVLNAKNQKKIAEKYEKTRQEKYRKYIEAKIIEINSIVAKQKSILIDNNVSISECENIINKKNRNLWERKIEHEDFLNVRIGNGNIAPQLLIDFPEEKFELFDDELLKYARDSITKYQLLEDVPINVSLAKKYVLAMIGSDYSMIEKYLEQFILQIVTFQSYEDVKIVFLTENEESKICNELMMLPHCWDNFKEIRFTGNKMDDVKYISSYLEEEFNKREIDEASETAETAELEEKTYEKFSPYYVIFTDSLKIARNTEIAKKILRGKKNYGFSMVIINNKLSNLPNQCFEFINIDKVSCGLFENELVSNKQIAFTPNIDYDINVETDFQKLANIPIKFSENKIPLPDKIGFLEMYNVGNIGQLNILNRWERNSPITSLAVPVGIDEDHDVFKLDLHEKAHGPHGLIAGMTGSGKSEFIITYILSLAINYSPDEVNIVIIDYKGGGLAGAFYNKEAKIKLPHLVGVITNLETNEIRRSIVSINSELKRRQRIFNETREKFNESTIDIYKYQSLYREKKVKEPLAHLFIISDEFAELKSQQPEFLDNLISIARIGRSLGVHLILATQKPSGVVNEQIWSNSKFKVCLKVQDKSDSMDMLHREEAASLKNTGRFYLQVGYNEIFKLGQSAWSGEKYKEQDKVCKTIDTSLNFVNKIGQTIKKVNDVIEVKTKSVGDELTNIVKYICKISEGQQVRSHSLWLDSLPSIITIDEVKEKYNYKKNSNFDIIIGEYDAPDEQKQNPLIFSPISSGNSIIYGNVESGKEELLKTIIYSAITSYSPDEINFYIIDFGAEYLKLFKNAPHVGDIILQDDAEKLTNLFKFISKEKNRRKDLLSEYNGYSDYIKVSNEKLPYIVIMINSYETFAEAYPNFEDLIIQYTRECLRYGIAFIITSSAATGVRYKVKHNFLQNFVLQLSDRSDYGYIFGNTRGLEPTKVLGRGLILENALYEFQTAFITSFENDKDKISEAISLMNYSYRAERIPILPKKVNMECFKDANMSLPIIPIGIGVNSLKPVNYDLYSSCGHIIAGQSKDNIKYFVQELIKELKYMNSYLIVFDSVALLTKLENSTNYFKDKFEEKISILIDYFDKVEASANKDTCKNIFIIFTDALDTRNKLAIDKRLLFDKMIEKAYLTKKGTILFLGDAALIKNMMYETWFTGITKSDLAIWVGDGIQNQSAIKVGEYLRTNKQNLTNDFGYIVSGSKPELTKLITDEEFYREKEEEL